MLKIAIAILVGLEVILLGAWHSVSASPPPQSSAHYTWGYASVGSDRLVCKKIAWNPDSERYSTPDKTPGQVNALIVSEDFCTHLTKPSISSPH